MSWAIARWYAPSLGRFISEDALLGRVDQPDTRNLYAYGSGDSANRTDPLGTYWYKVQAGDSLLRLALRIYSDPLAVFTIASGNPGGKITPRNLWPWSTLSAGDCIWIPFRNLAPSEWKCNFHPEVVYWPYGRGLVERFTKIQTFMYNHMVQDRADGAGGVGMWLDCPMAIAWCYPFDALVSLEWANRTAGGHSWDYKKPLVDAFNRNAGTGFWTAVPGDPAPEVLFYDVWSNIHFGYVGRAHHIPADILHAGSEQLGGIRSISDWASVDAGIQLWEKFGMNLSAGDLGNAIRQNLSTYRFDKTNKTQVLPGLHG